MTISENDYITREAQALSERVRHYVSHLPWRMLAFSQVMAVLWWLVALFVSTLHILPIWIDQELHLTYTASHFLTPYQLPGYVYPPWMVVLLLPFNVMTLPLSTFIQTALLFGLLTLVIYKYGGGKRALLTTFLSFIALDAVLELNVDWIVLVGLLVRPVWSGPFLLLKPQDALGVVMTYKRHTMLRMFGVALVVVLLALLVWGFWPLPMWNAIRIYSLGRSFNLAPLSLIPWPLSIAIGFVLAVYAVRRRDRALSILAWLFFVPYITLCSLLLPFAMLTFKSARLALIISVVMWIIYGSVLVIGLAHRV